MDEQKQKAPFSGKVCLVGRSISSKHDDGGGNVFRYEFVVVNLCELYKRDLQPSMVVELGDCEDLNTSMEVCGLDSQVYFVNHLVWDTRKVYYLDIQHQPYQQHVSAADLPTLPPMLGFKNFARVTPIPGTKRFLVFSSLFYVDHNDPYDRASSVVLAEDEDEDEDEDINKVDFEMYDVETKSWEKLPDLLIHIAPRNFYILHETETDQKIIGVPVAPVRCNEIRISRYSFIHKDGDTKTLYLLVQLNLGVMLTLDVSSRPSKGWKLYNEVMVTNPPISSKENIIGFQDRYPLRWCASSDIGGAATAVRFPQSEFREEGDRVKPLFCSKLTPLEDEKHVCIVQGGVNRDSKLPQLVMDVVDVHNLAKPVASARFRLLTHKCNYFMPCCIFVYHPQQEEMQVEATEVFPQEVDQTDDGMHGTPASSGGPFPSTAALTPQQQAELQARITEQRKKIKELSRQLVLMQIQLNASLWPPTPP